MKRRNERTRTTSPPPSGVRVSAWRAAVVVACAAVALVVSLLYPVYAYAADYQDVWNHQSIDGGQQYIVGAYNAYDAAAFVCGYSSSTVGAWDLPTLGKLSNAPAVVSLVDGFGNVTPWNDDLLHDNCEQYFGSELWRKMQYTYGGTGGIYINSGGLDPVQLKYWQDNMPAGMHVYALNTTSEAVGAAKEAFRAILAGEDTGSSGGVVGDYLEFNVLLGTCPSTFTNSNQPFYFQNSLDNKYYGNRIRSVADGSSSSKNIKLPDVIKVRFPLSVFSPTPVNGETYFLRFTPSNCYIYKADDNNSYTLNTSTYTVSQNDISYTSSYYSLYGIFYSFNSAISYQNKRFSYSDGLATYVGKSSISLNTNTSTQDFSSLDANGMPTYGWIGTNVYSGGGDDPDPPNNWPDDGNNTTVAPSPPELPTPKDPTTPTEPDPDPPYYYTPPTPDPPAPDPPYEPTEPTGTSPTDYTPWLRAILRALGGISANLATHCQHLQAQMKAQATRIIQGINNQLVNLGTSINGAIGDWAKWLGECLGEGLETLTDNLYDMFHWLAEQFDFTFAGDPYDDSGIIGWLRRIYNRLGSDPKHYAPTILDPGSEGEEQPFDFWAWLLERIAAILGGVLGGATDAVSTLLEGIRGKFPFSIPWDLLAFLGMLSGDRAIPVFTFTIPAIQGWWGEVPIRVDLTPYDSAAQACRTMVLIWWAFVLAMKSTWMINDVLGAVGSSIVSRFTGRLVGTAS